MPCSAELTLKSLEYLDEALFHVEKAVKEFDDIRVHLGNLVKEGAIHSTECIETANSLLQSLEGRMKHLEKPVKN